jgi:hypothetical protein
LGDVLGHSGYRDGKLVGVSAAAGAAERIELPFPPAGNYVVAGVGYAAQPGGFVYDGAARRRRPV